MAEPKVKRETITLRPVDVDALERSIVMAAASSPERAAQIEAKLKNEPWIEVATFASYCCQDDALHLKPWQPPPCWMGKEKPVDDFPGAGRVAAWELRTRLDASGLSMYEPEPVKALQEAAQHVPPPAWDVR